MQLFCFQARVQMNARRNVYKRPNFPVGTTRFLDKNERYRTKSRRRKSNEISRSLTPESIFLQFRQVSITESVRPPPTVDDYDAFKWIVFSDGVFPEFKKQLPTMFFSFFFFSKFFYYFFVRVFDADKPATLYVVSHARPATKKRNSLTRTRVKTAIVLTVATYENAIFHLKLSIWNI